MFSATKPCRSLNVIYSLSLVKSAKLRDQFRRQHPKSSMKESHRLDLVSSVSSLKSAPKSLSCFLKSFKAFVPKPAWNFLVKAGNDLFPLF